MGIGLKIHREWDFFRASIVATYKDWAAYKSHMALTMFLAPAQLLIQYYIWKAVYAAQPSFAGMDFDGMMRYFVVSTLIGLVTFDFAEWNTGMLIRTGKMTTFLLRPIAHVRYALYQKVGHRLLSFWMEVLPVALISFLLLRVPLSTPHPVLSAISLALSFFITFCINYTIGSVSFWLTNNDGVSRIIGLLSSLTAGVFFPLTLFPPLVQNILFCLPFQFTSYLPTRVFLGDYRLGDITMDVGTAVLLQAAVAVAMFVINRMVWQVGVKKHMGVGV